MFLEKTMTNRDLLKEAIADAKVVKETAIANAKLALEETFNPFLKERLAAVLAEMDEMEEGEEELKEEMHDDAMEEDMKMDDTEEKMEEDMDLEELLRELEEMDSLNEAEDLLNDPKGPTAKGNVAEEEAAKVKEVEDLIEAKKRELAIAALKVDGILDSDAKITPAGKLIIEDQKDGI
jgi:hypothetical protein